MTDKEKLIKIKSLADKMSDTAFNMTTNASLLRKAMDEYHQFIINEYHKEEQIIKELREEPVSKELEQAAVEAFKEIVDDERNSFLEIFKAGAKWQKQQDNNDANHALVEQIKTQQMWYEKGMADMKQQMTANAIDVTVYIDAGGYPYIPQMELYDYDKDVPLAKEGDKYKVVLIKED